MERYKFIGSQAEADCYLSPRPKVGGIYRADEEIGELPVNHWATELWIKEEWEKCKDTFDCSVSEYLKEINNLLVSKNIKYGNSALEPLRIFSKGTSSDQLLARIDDKLSRIKNGSLDEDEDVVKDLIGYLVLLEISRTDK